MRTVRGSQLLAILGGWTCLAFACAAGEVKFMSYNILANPDEPRVERLANAINSESPDVLGLQELVGENSSQLLERLGDDYTVLFGDTLDPVLVKRSNVLRIVDQGTQELFRCQVDRQVNWVRLADADSGDAFIFYNTHLCFILLDNLEGLTNEEANQVQAGEIIDLMAAHAEDELVQIIAGDLNTFASSNTTRFFIEGRPLPYTGKENPLSLKDTWPAAPGNSGEKPSTRAGRIPGQGSAGGAPGAAGMGARFQMLDEPGIDWIFVSQQAEVTAAEVIRNELSTGTSDHLPITATVRF